MDDVSKLSILSDGLLIVVECGAFSSSGVPLEAVEALVDIVRSIEARTV